MDFILNNWAAILFITLLIIWIVKPSKSKGCCDRGRLFRPNKRKMK